jgi:hypothetical protein
VVKEIAARGIAAKPGRAIAGNIDRNTAAMRHTVIAEQPASSVDVAPVAPVVRAASGDLVVQVV